MSYGPPTALSAWVAAVLFLVAVAVQGARIESISATVDRKPVKHETFVPLVAFKCGYRNKFLNESGDWQDDKSSAAVCLEGKLDILKYCKRVYPDRKITNIVEYGHISHIQDWCKSGHGCQSSFYVRPYRCIEGEFVADSLQVPSKCKFGHVSGRDTCDDFQSWSKKAESQCSVSLDDHDHKPMRMHSFAMLEPCGLSLFRGVEYVCCPRAVEAEFMESKVDEYLNTEADDDEDDDDDDDEELSEDDDKKSKDDEQDPYFTDEPQSNEHERYRDAQERLEKKYRAKVTKVITEWSELFERYNKMKAKDPEGAETYKSEMTSRFRKTVASLEDENKEQQRQLEELHDERVQAALNEKKRKATHDYRMALAIQVGHVNKQNVLRTLKDYIRAEEKDRAHMLNRYRHLLRSNPDGASSFEPMLLHRLRYIDLRINGTLAMLRDFPELERQIRPIAEDYWHSYRRENTPEIDGKLMEVDENQKDSNEQLVQLYKDAIERKTKTTRVQSTFNEVVKKSHKNADLKKKFVPLKDVLSDKEKDKEVLVEDSDEDQFEEDDEAEDDNNADDEKDSNDEQIQTSPIVVNETVAAEKAAEKLAEQQRFAKEQHAHKLAREQGRELPVKQSIKAFDLSNTKDNKVTDNDAAESNEATEDDDDVDENEKDDEIEFVEPDRLFVRKEVEPAYAKHDRLMADGDEPYEHVTSGFWTSQTSLLVYITMVLCVLAVAAIIFRHRPSRQGFIEVDVCNPDDCHVNKMQVNGYENPSYENPRFFDSKP